MLHLTPEIQRSLGDAVIVPDGDGIYIYSHEGWMILLLALPNWMSPELVNWLRNTNTSYDFVNWGVLTAVDVNLDEKKYLPHGHRKYESIFLSSNWTSKYSPDSLRRNAQQNIGDYMASPMVSLTAMFNDGKARPLYDKPNDGFAKGANADRYIFRFDDRLVVADAVMFQAFADMGFTITCPTESPKGVVPPLGLQHESGQVFGYMKARQYSGIKESPYGGELSEDAATICWFSEEMAKELLFDQKHYPLEHGVLLADVVGNKWQGTGARKAVSILRWRGWSDDDIVALYESFRITSWTRRHEVHQHKLEGICERLTQEMNSWQFRNLEEDLQRICKEYEFLKPALGVELGILPEAVSLLELASTEPERLAMEG
jgi:hypothetical protein